MKDIKFKVAVLVIVLLVVALLYLTVLGPQIQGYLIKTQVNAYESAIKDVINRVEQQGYVVLRNEESQIVLVPAQIPEEQLPEQQTQPEMQE